MASFNTRADANDGAPLAFLTGVTRAARLVARSAAALVSQLANALRTFRQRERDKVELGRMSHYELHDIHVSSSDRWAEISKPFWRK